MKSLRKEIADVPSKPSHDADFHAWAVEQANALRERRIHQLDWEHLAEEVEDLGRSERREVRSRIQVILIHLLKWAIQPRRRSASWRATLISQRRELNDLLGENPSLVRELETIAAKAYKSALPLAAADMRLTDLQLRKLPQSLCFEVEQILDERYFPESLKS